PRRGPISIISKTLGASAAISVRLEPGDDLCSILVRRKYRIEDLGYHIVVDHERHALEQRHAGNREGRELDGARELELGVGEDRERQMQPLGGLPLIAGGLRRKPIEVGDAERSDLGKMVA